MLSFSSVFSDTRNFMANNLASIIMVLAVVAIIAQIITLAFYPNIETLGPIKSLMEQAVQKYGDLSAQSLTPILNELSEQEKNQLAPLAMSYLMSMCLVFFVTNLISVSCTLSLIYNLSHRQFTLSNLLKNMLTASPLIILFMLFSVPCFMVLFIIVSLIPPLAAPLIILGSLLYAFIYILFLAVIVEPNNQRRFMHKVKITFHFLKREKRMIMPMIAIWLLATVVLSTLTGVLGSNLVIDIILSVISLLINFMVLCYFYRLYTLTNQVLPYDTSY